MMLSKDVFFSVISSIQSQLKADRIISAHLAAITGGNVNYDTGHALPGLINFLIRVVKDDERWIEYWLYELEEGKLWRPGITKIDGRYMRLKAPIDLYKLICKKYKENAGKGRYEPKTTKQ